MDRRGFGQSQGKRADIKAEEDILEDHWQFFEAVSFLRGYHPNTPKFIMGHSLGALYASRICQRNPNFFKGQILINPLFEFKNKISAFKKAALTAKKMMQFNER